MLSKKPLGGWSCASCEKQLTNLINAPPEHQHWNRMPYRDPNERMAKIGQGFSKMLQMIKPIDVGQSRLTVDDTYLTQMAGNNTSLIPDLKN